MADQQSSDYEITKLLNRSDGEDMRDWMLRSGGEMEEQRMAARDHARGEASKAGADRKVRRPVPRSSKRR